MWKILKEMGIPDHLTCLLRNCMQVRKQQLKLDMEQQTVSKLGKEYIKAEYCHPAYLTYMQCWGFFPQDLETTNLKEQHSDSLSQGLTSLFL